MIESGARRRLTEQLVERVWSYLEPLWDKTRSFRDIESFTFPWAWEWGSERASQQIGLAERSKKGGES